jgi:hypothetical protein
MGLNPSKATKEKSDTTVAKVEQVAKQNGFDGFVMLNLYPVRATNLKDLPDRANPKALAKNLACIEATIALESCPVLWAAWGKNILAKDFFVEAAKKLFAQLEKYNIDWQHFGPLTASGHPRHPSRLKYAWSFAPFNTQSYIRVLRT